MLLSVFVGILFLQSKRARALSLTSGLMVRIWCSHCYNTTSVSGQEPKPCFNSLQARDRLFSILNSTNLQLHRGCISDNYSQKTIIVKYKKIENITDQKYNYRSMENKNTEENLKDAFTFKIKKNTSTDTRKKKKITTCHKQEKSKLLLSSWSL